MAAHPWASQNILSGLEFTLCLGEAQFLKLCHRRRLPGEWSADHMATTHLFTQKGMPLCVVTIGEWESHTLNELHALLAHEAVHVWQHTKRYMGEDSPGDEIEAYAIQNICLELFRLCDILKERG